MDSIKICQKCNTQESATHKFCKERLMCNKCKYQSRLNDNTKVYIQDYYQKYKKSYA